MTREPKDCQCPRVRHEHGDWRTYASDNCHCTPCRAAWTAYTADLRKRRYLAGGTLLVNGIGTARRLQGLACAGYGSAELAQHLGHTSRFTVEDWRKGANRVSLASHLLVKRLADELWDQRPTRGYPSRTARWARLQGFVPLLAWDDDLIDNQAANVEDYAHIRQAVKPILIDEIAVERAMRGDRVRLTRAEVTEAHARLNLMGLTAREIAQRLHTTDRTVVRRRSAAA